MKAFSDFVARYLAVLVIAATAVALVFPGVSAIIRPGYISYILGIIMFGMGLAVRASDFRDVFLRPKAVLLGICAQFVLMPAIAAALIFAFSLPPELAIGVALVGCCPGGTSSNVISYLSRADVALSVCITSCTTLLAPVATPLLLQLLVGHHIAVDMLAMFKSIIQVVIVPIALGVLLTRFLPLLALALSSVLPLISTLGIAAIVMSVVGTSAAAIMANIGLIFAVVIAHNLLGYAAGYATGRLFGCGLDARKTLAIEVGMQNSGLAAGLAAVHFAAMPLVAVPAALFSVWHNVSGGVLAGIFRRMN